MIDTDKLRGAIYERKTSQRKVAKMLGMTEKTFYAKMKKGIFGSDEIEALIYILGLENPWAIFFVKKVS